MSILSVAISHSEVPEVLDFSEVLDHEEVILVRLSNTITCLASTCQISKLRDQVFYFLDISLRLAILLSRL